MKGELSERGFKRNPKDWTELERYIHDRLEERIHQRLWSERPDSKPPRLTGILSAVERSR